MRIKSVLSLSDTSEDNTLIHTHKDIQTQHHILYILQDSLSHMILQTYLNVYTSNLYRDMYRTFRYTDIETHIQLA